jgi:hypothetical protein
MRPANATHPRKLTMQSLQMINSASQLRKALAKRNMTVSQEEAEDILRETMPVGFEPHPETVFLQAVVSMLSDLTLTEDMDGFGEDVYTFTAKKDKPHNVEVRNMGERGEETITHSDPSVMGMAYALRLAQALSDDPEPMVDFASSYDLGRDEKGETILLKTAHHTGLEEDEGDEDEPECLHCVAREAYNDFLEADGKPPVTDIEQVHPAGHLLFFKVHAEDQEVYVLHQCDQTVSRAINHPALFTEVPKDLTVIGAKVVIADSLAPAVESAYQGAPCEGHVVSVSSDQTGDYVFQVKTLMTTIDVPITDILVMTDEARPVIAKHLH